jgi:tetratricopeptide (TPR) repeat protein
MRLQTLVPLLRYSVTPISSGKKQQKAPAPASSKTTRATVSAAAATVASPVSTATGSVSETTELDLCCATLPTVELDPRVLQMAQDMRADAKEACNTLPGLSQETLSQQVYDSLCAAAESFYDDGHADRAFITYMAALMEADAAERLLPTAQRLQTASAANNVGVLLMHSGQNNDAAAAYLQLAHGIQEAAFGRTHANTLKSASQLATLLAQMGKLEHAMELYIAILDDFKETVGESSTEYGETLLKMAVTYTHASVGAVEAGEINSLFEKSTRILSETASDKLFLASAMVQHALWLATLGVEHVSASETNILAALGIIEGSEGEKSSHLAPILVEYAQLLIEWGRSKDALEHIDRARHIIEASVPPLPHAEGLQHRLISLLEQATTPK